MSGFSKLSAEFDQEHINAMADRQGRHYMVSKEGKLMKMQAYDSSSAEFSIRNKKESKALKSNELKTTKIIFPTSSSESIQQFINYSGRYVQRTNNTSMSIRDYVEAKGQKRGSISSKKKHENSIDIRSWN